MDPHPTPFPGTIHSRKPKFLRKTSELPKTHLNQTLIHREKRVFGTARNQNVMTKSMPEKAKNLLVPVKSLFNNNPSSTEFSKTPKKSPLQNQGRVKKTVNFKEGVENKLPPERDVSGSQTPLRSPFLVKPRALGTPFMSAEKCSKCRFDKLETSSYWIAQIKLAESVGKHFASAMFFNLALQCRAEPLRNMKVEVKKYMARNEDLSNEEEWKALSIDYGLLLKDESRLRDKEYDDDEEEGNTESTKIVSTEEDKNAMDQESKEDAGDEQI